MGGGNPLPIERLTKSSCVGTEATYRCTWGNLMIAKPVVRIWESREKGDQTCAGGVLSW